MAAGRLTEGHIPYEWGVHDCLATVGDVLRLAGAPQAAYRWSGMVAGIRGGDEARTAVRAKRRYGSVRAAIEHGLTDCGMILVDGAHMTYDVLLLEDASDVWDVSLGFVDENGSVRVWSDSERLFMILREPKVKAIYRVPMDMVE